MLYVPRHGSMLLLEVRVELHVTLQVIQSVVLMLI